VNIKHFKKKYFEGGALWAQRYFVETIGNSNKEVIRVIARYSHSDRV